VKYLAKTSFGLEEILAEEIKNLGGIEIEILNRAVRFEGDLECLYKVNLWSRTALRVLQPILEFKAHNETVLYKRLRRYDWTQLIDLDQTFKVEATVNSELFTHSKYISLKVKDAIVDLFRLKKDNRRPSIDFEQPDFVIDVYCKGSDFIISLDSSGESLHRRGYRQSHRRAPLNEVLAAGMILLSGWDPDTPLLDPMCGSGTILTEAYMIAKEIPPRRSREHFAFMNWTDYDKALWKRIELESLKGNDRKVQIVGYDIDKDQAQETRELIAALEFDDIRLAPKDFFQSEKPFDTGMIITNPPYGLRIEDPDLGGFYKKIGDTFKQQYSNWKAWVLSGNKKALKKLGLRTSKRLQLFNGQIECKFHLYEMYEGKR